MKRAREFAELEQEEERQEYLEKLKSRKKDLIIPLENGIVKETVVQALPKPKSSKPLKYGLTVPSKREIKMEIDAKPILSKRSWSNLPEKAQFKEDMLNRPDVADLESYYKVPIEDFGMAMLRGMGWNQGQPIGKNPNGIIEAVKIEPRPSLLGLGAKPVEIEEPRKKIVRPGDNIKVEKVEIVENIPPPRNSRIGNGFQVGDSVIITSGSKKNQSGKIKSIQERNDGIAVYVICDQTRKLLSVWDDEIENRYWLRPRIRVRIISSTIGDGKYNGAKCIVKDVSRPGICTLEMPNGLALDNISQHDLETVIPKLERTVMVVGHHLKSLNGQLGQLLECDDEKEVGLIRMDLTYDIEHISYDAFSEYCENLH